MMAVINKLISVAFFALLFVVVAEEEKSLAICVTSIGATIMITTLGSMCYWIIQHKTEAANARNIRRSSINSNVLQNKYKKMYSI